MEHFIPCFYSAPLFCLGDTVCWWLPLGLAPVSERGPHCVSLNVYSRYFAFFPESKIKKKREKSIGGGIQHGPYGRRNVSKSRGLFQDFAALWGEWLATSPQRRKVPGSNPRQTQDFAYSPPALSHSSKTKHDEASWRVWIALNVCMEINSSTLDEWTLFSSKMLFAKDIFMLPEWRLLLNYAPFVLPHIATSHNHDVQFAGVCEVLCELISIQAI